jgi:hypothetical protein
MLADPPNHAAMLRSSATMGGTIPAEVRIYLEAESEVHFLNSMYIAVRAPHTASDSKNPERRRIFQKLATRWHNDTDALSSPSQKLGHLSYDEIIAMGSPVLQYILEDLRDKGGDWFTALEKITNYSPLQEGDEEYEDYGALRRAWLDWGSRQGLIG